MSDDTAIFVGASDADQFLLLKYANRHGLIAGATGTGKTVTLQMLAEGFSAPACRCSWPTSRATCRASSQAGGDNPEAVERARSSSGIDGYAGARLPGDLLGPVRRAGPSGPRHRGRDGPAAAGPPAGAERHPGGRAQHRLQGRRRPGPAAARPQGPAARCCSASAENAGELTTEYGNVSKATIGTIQRALLTLEQQGGEHFFGEPALELEDLMRPTPRRPRASSTCWPPTS